MTNAITSFFLRAKHWQLFLLLAVVPMIAEFAVAVSLPMTVRSWREFTRVDFFFVAATTLYMLCFLAWFWSLGSFLNSIVKPELKLKTTFLHIALIYPAIYMPFFLAVFFDLKPELFMVVLPLHFFAMFCIFYLLRFASKTLALAETGRTVSFYDYAGPFFLLWFYPVGVWIIQPRINRLYAENTVTASRLRP
jgi:hypothetical protein